MFEARSIKYCKSCGGEAAYSVPPDDNRERAICKVCGTIHYENPINVVGTLPIWNDKVLLCRRNIEPRHGFWTLPAGFMELGETTARCDENRLRRARVPELRTLAAVHVEIR